MILPNSFIKTVVKDDLSFVDFMNLALYSPEYGYYTSDLQKIGPKGDFITAPELTPLFGMTIANQCQQILQTIKNPVILEFGAGTGQLCAQILKRLEVLNCLPTTYYILELSGNLAARQKTYLQKTVPHLIDRLRWLKKWPEKPLAGIFIANEVLDAMPVHRFLQTEQGIFESFVHLQANKTLIETFKPCTNPRLLAYVDEAVPKEYMPYTSEVNLFLDGWIEQCANCLEKGCILLLDYGFPRHEFYHPDRNQGTLVCHYQHKVHSNPFINLGLQDITAHVDFTQIALAARRASLDVAGYTNQASFLVSNGLLDLLDEISDERELVHTNQCIKQLLQPQEMGELFKVIALTKGEFFSLNGFKWFDKRATL